MENSKLMRFLHRDKKVLIHYLDGEELVANLFTSQRASQTALLKLRQLVLSGIPFIHLLKSGENLSLSIQSDSPSFKFFLEMHTSGQFRTLLLPRDHQHFPSTFSGSAKLTKISPLSKIPYTSILQLKQVPFHEIANSALMQSYQIQGTLWVGDKIDHSMLLMVLPHHPLKEAEFQESIQQFQNLQQQLDTSPNSSVQQRIGIFKLFDYEPIGDTPIEFRCHCSQERMLSGIAMLSLDDIEYLYLDNKATVETLCEYCQTAYLINKHEVMEKKRQTVNRKD